MRELLPETLFPLAEKLKAPLYVVGGFVRGLSRGPFPRKARFRHLFPRLRRQFFSPPRKAADFIPAAVYRHTGTVKLKDGQGHDFEYTCFRSDKYVRGTHVPVETFFTDDIRLDARRRDFTVNAVYYDVRAGGFADPWGYGGHRSQKAENGGQSEKGVRRGRAAADAAVPLCGGSSALSPTKSAWRVQRRTPRSSRTSPPSASSPNLPAILHADGQYGVPYGHYAGLKLLEETGVLAQILPELALGKDMGQRKDFHKYDVLEHSLRAAKNTPTKRSASPPCCTTSASPSACCGTATPMPTPKRAGGSRGKSRPLSRPPSARRSVVWPNSSGCTCTTSTAGQSRENCGGFSCGTHPCSTTCSS